MHVPKAGERVYVDGRKAIFVVAGVDDETQTADLVPLTGRAPREEYVPWQKLFRCWKVPIKRSSRLASASDGVRFTSAD